MTDEVEEVVEGMSEQNDQLILIAGYSAAGKSASLRNIRNQDNWLYLNCEAGKRLPFRNKFRNVRVTDPYEVLSAFDYATNDDPEIIGIIVDSLTFLMDMYESQYVLKSTNKMTAWGDFQQFFKELMQEKVTLFGKPVIFIAHVKEETNEKTLVSQTSVPIKGALRGNGIEAYFSTVVAAKKMTLKELKEYKSDLLTITEDEEIDGFKYVFQTKLTKNSTGERIRGPMGMFTRDQTFIDNDCQILLDHLTAYYADEASGA